MVSIEITNVKGKVVGLNPLVSSELKQKLSYEPDDASYLRMINPKLLYRDLRKYLYQEKRGYFPVGLLTEVREFLDERNIKYSIIDKRVVAEQYNFYYIKCPFYDLYPHQEKALAEIKARPSNAISIATGGGKTLIAMKAIEHWGVNTLVIVPTLNLVEQFKANLILHYGKENVGTHKDKKLKPIVVANVQGLQRKKQAFFDHFDAVIEDEAHHVSSDSHYNLNKKYWEHIGYRLFLSATMYRNDGAELKLTGLTGDITYAYTAREAINDGFIVRPKFAIYKINHKYGPLNKGWHEDYKYGIVKNKNRNNMIAKCVNSILANTDKNLLILCNRKEHCDTLQELIKEEAVIVTGDTKDNAKTFDKYRMGEIRCMIATSQVVGEGVDIPNIDVLVLAGGYTSPILLNQSVGRVVRLDKERGKTYGMVIDFYDVNAGILENHSKSRLRTYAKNYFKEDIKLMKTAA